MFEHKSSDFGKSILKKLVVFQCLEILDQKKRKTLDVEEIELDWWMSKERCVWVLLLLLLFCFCVCVRVCPCVRAGLCVCVRVCVCVCVLLSIGLVDE